MTNQDDVEADSQDPTAVALKDRTSNFEDPAAGSVVMYITEKMKLAEDARQEDEQRWLTAYKNYMGEYTGSEFTETEKSEIFVKVTKTKVIAAYGQIIDVLFGTDKFPIGVSPTPIPEGIKESVHYDMQPAPQAPASGGLQPGDTLAKIKERELGVLESKLAGVRDGLKDGPGTTQQQITYHPAKEAAAKHEKKIQDQLVEAGANNKTRRVIFEMCLFGTGVMKGPFVIDKEYPKWEVLDNGQVVYQPVKKTTASVDHVRIWDFYPDKDAATKDEAEYVIQRHKLSRSKLRNLKKRPMFRSKAIDVAIGLGENYIEKWWENQIIDTARTGPIERFEVLEFWGEMDAETLRDFGVKIPPEFEDKDSINVNCWVCNDQVLRLVINSFKPTRIPYHVVPYELNPYSMFGVGVAENMEDTQKLMNGFMRLAVDNAVLSGNVILDVDEGALEPNQDYTIYPGKVFKRNSGQPGNAVNSIEIPNVSAQNLQLFDKARILADESTGIPSFSHGQTGVTGVGRTSSGISMLLSASHGSTRTVIKNVDDYLLEPLGKDMYYFNMQFDFEKELLGDFEVNAKGTESLMANEVYSQRLMQFLSVVLNPMLAPFVRLDYIVEQLAKSLDLDPKNAVNSLNDAMLQAAILQKFQATMAPPDQAGSPSGPPSVNDSQGSGNGNIGIGTSPTPGEDGFTGSPGGGNATQKVN